MRGHGIRLRTNGHVRKVHLYSTLAFAPVKALLKQTKVYRGCFSCFRCNERGINIKRCLVFPSTNGKPRTNNDFMAQRQEEHYIRSLLFKALTIGMVYPLLLDYMLAVCHGLMKPLIGIWRRGESRREVPICSTSISVLDEQLASMHRFISCHFSKKCRTLSEVDF